MSSYKKTGIRGFSKTVVDSLQFWTADIQNGVCDIIDEKSEKLRALIQENAPVRTKAKCKKRRKGKYKKSWKVKINSDKFSYYEAVVHASGNEYRLTHLLEKPHASRNGGRVEPQVHIAPARDQIEKEYIRDVENLIKSSQSTGGGLRRTVYKK